MSRPLAATLSRLSQTLFHPQKLRVSLRIALIRALAHIHPTSTTTLSSAFCLRAPQCLSPFFSVLQAVRGMNPKITIWTTGSEGGAGGVGGAAGGPGGVRALADIYKMLPPLATTVAEQTGIRPPSWMLDMSSVPVESSGSAVATAADGDAAAAPAGPAATAVVPVIPVPSSGAVSRAAAVPPPRPHANGAASASLSAPNPAAAARAAAAGISTILPGGKLV